VRKHQKQAQIGEIAGELMNRADAIADADMSLQKLFNLIGTSNDGR
jgi:hypothetical protein